MYVFMFFFNFFVKITIILNREKERKNDINVLVFIALYKKSENHCLKKNIDTYYLLVRESETHEKIDVVEYFP